MRRVSANDLAEDEFWYMSLVKVVPFEKMTSKTGVIVFVHCSYMESLFCWYGTLLAKMLIGLFDGGFVQLPAVGLLKLRALVWTQISQCPSSRGHLRLYVLEYWVYPFPIVIPFLLLYF